MRSHATMAASARRPTSPEHRSPERVRESKTTTTPAGNENTGQQLQSLHPAHVRIVTKGYPPVQYRRGQRGDEESDDVRTDELIEGCVRDQEDRHVDHGGDEADRGIAANPLSHSSRLSVEPTSEVASLR